VEIDGIMEIYCISLLQQGIEYKFYRIDFHCTCVDSKCSIQGFLTEPGMVENALSKNIF
jgi:hypothetical protein